MADEQQAQSGVGGDIANSLVTAGTSALGDVLAAKGNVVEGMALKTSAPVVGFVTGRGWVWAEQQARRIYESLNRVLQRARDEGVGNPLEVVADVVEEAIPIIGNAATEEKRRLIEDLILNAAERVKTAGDRAAAAHALSLIGEMTEPAAVLFGLLVSIEAQREGNPYTSEAEFRQEYGLPQPVFRAARRYLSERSLIQEEEQHRLSIRVGSNGAWLSEWVKRNP